MTENQLHGESNSGVGSGDGEERSVMGFAVASSEKNASFHEDFPDIPAGEYLIEDQPSDLGGYSSGPLSVSENHVCYKPFIDFGFYHTSSFSIPIHEITSLQKMHQRSLYITTQQAKEHRFVMYNRRDEMFSIIHKIWTAKALINLIGGDHQSEFKPEGATVDDVRKLLSLEETALDTLLGVEASKIPPVLDFLQTEIQNTVLDHEYRRKCGKYLRFLVNKHHILPPSLFINEVGMSDQHLLAVGGYSDIYKGILGNKSVCLKVLRLDVQEDEERTNKELREFYKETLLWTQLNHHNLLPFLGVNITLFPGKLCLVSPWMANGQITKFLEANPNHDKLRVISEIAAGILYLHSHDIVHGDIKGANILVDEQGRCYLADFGLAVASVTNTLLGSTTKSGAKGTIRWMAPELLGDDSDEEAPENPKPDNVKLPVDIYAYACTVYEIIAGKVPFELLSDVQVMLTVIAGRRPERPMSVDWCPDNIWALVQQCWAQESHLRPTVVEVHGFLLRLERLRGEGRPWEKVFLDPRQENAVY